MTKLTKLSAKIKCGIREITSATSPEQAKHAFASLKILAEQVGVEALAAMKFAQSRPQALQLIAEVQQALQQGMEIAEAVGLVEEEKALAKRAYAKNFLGKRMSNKKATTAALPSLMKQ